MEKIQGYIDHFIYRNTENGYCVLELHTEDDELICVGNFPGIDQGETVSISGEYVEHPVYGRQLKAFSVETIEPEDVASIERYLASGAVKGVGPALAKRIVKRFKADTFRIMEEEPERLVEIKGISERKAIEIASYMENKKEIREAFLFLQKYGISNVLSVKIYDTYGNRLYSVLQENPYRLAEEIDGIGFKKADEIAEKVGIRVDSEYRIQSGVLYALGQASQEGHIYLPQDELLQRSEAILGVEKQAIAEILPNIAMDKKIVIRSENEEVRCYQSMAFYEELACARLLQDLNSYAEIYETDAAMHTKLCKLEKTLGIELDELQQEAVKSAVLHGVFILSGGPGTGKTTTINTMIKYFEQSGMDFMLAAPTGRAAKRMTEATGFEAKTIHRLLELNGAFLEDGKRARFERDENNPLETDVVIIDEMSMVDIHLFYALLKAIPHGCRLILVGDVNQLPSVGPGQVLKDLIESQAYATIILKKIFRQAAESDIVLNAHNINEGKELVLDNKSKDFFYLERSQAEVIYKHLVLLITEKLPKYVDATPMQIQVLTPMRKGNLGVETLNTILQKYINPPSSDKKEYEYGDVLFREGDKVMQTKNNYQLEWEIVSKYGIPIDKGTGIFNGDMGTVIAIHEYNKTMEVEYDEKRRVTYPFSGLDELELAYAVTIHKSQGSEYPAVLIPLLGGPKQLLNRNLLYTGVTRAKKCVTILGSKDTLREMIENGNQKKRYTGLQERIREVERNL